MSREIWARHFDRRMAEAEERWPRASKADPEAIWQWASQKATDDTADELASSADRWSDEAKERGL